MSRGSYVFGTLRTLVGARYARRLSRMGFV